MADLPKITIVTPSYNQGEFIEATIRSILDQNYPNLEYIIMDGGSTDESVEIIKKYETSLSYWESHPDKGQADAIYRGFERATGEILGWVNSDDLLLPGALVKVGNWFAMHPHEEWVVGGSTTIDQGGEILRDRFGFPQCRFGAHVTFHKLLFYGCPFVQPASFWRRSAFFEVGGFEKSFHFCFDYDLFFRLSRRHPSGCIKKMLAAFRVHKASKGGTLRDVQNVENKLLWEKYGRFNKWAMYRRIVNMFYDQDARFRSLWLRLNVMFGLLRSSECERSKKSFI